MFILSNCTYKKTFGIIQCPPFLVTNKDRIGRMIAEILTNYFNIIVYDIYYYYKIKNNYGKICLKKD